MAPLIPDGVYKIRNVQFTRQVADLIYANPDGPISGYRANNDSHNQDWRVENHGGGGNQVYLQNVASGTYASSAQFPGARLHGSPDDPTLWTVVKLDRGQYYLQSPDALYVWELPSDRDFENIRLSEFTGEDKTKWTFQKVKLL